MAFGRRRFGRRRRRFGRRRFRRRRFRRVLKRGRVGRTIRRGFENDRLPERMFVRMRKRFNQAGAIQWHFIADDGKAYFLIQGNVLHTGGSVKLDGYDRMITKYRRYIVHGSKIRVQLYTAASTAPLGTATLVPIRLEDLHWMFPATPTAKAPSIAGARSIPNFKQRFIGTRDSGQGMTVLKSYQSTTALFSRYEIDHLRGTIGLQPQIQPDYTWYWILEVDSMSATTLTTSLYLNIDVTYYTTWFHSIPQNIPNPWLWPAPIESPTGSDASNGDLQTAAGADAQLSSIPAPDPEVLPGDGSEDGSLHGDSLPDSPGSQLAELDLPTVPSSRGVPRYDDPGLPVEPAGSGRTSGQGAHWISALAL